MQVYTYVNIHFEMYPLTRFSIDAKFTPKQVFCFKFDPLNRSESDEFE